MTVAAERTSQVAPKDASGLSRRFFEQLPVLEEGTPEYHNGRNTPA